MTHVIDMQDQNARSLYAFATWRAALRMEAVGMKHSSGRSVRKHVAQHFGLPVRTPHADLVERLTNEIEAIHQAREN